MTTYNTAFRAAVTPSALTPREIAANVAALGYPDGWTSADDLALEGALRKTGCILEDVKKATSPHVSMRTYYHGGGTGSPELATIHQIIEGAQTIITKAL